ncbi:MAG: CinA family nicotinamide mononucleotide deamidase-related protein [Syntrophobacterales bacterium]|jgi:nicotinamide-nucleotide amidase
MHGELITVGNELLSGLVVNSNAAHIAHHLGLSGFLLRWVTVVGDREEDITTALVRGMERASFVLVTGGLGPTDDDRTSEAAARALGRPLRRDALSWDILTGHLKKRKMSMKPGIAKMADLPEGAQRIDHILPRAGYYIGDAAKPLFFLPGVPEEMADMLREFVLPTLKERFPERMTVRYRILRVFGLMESEIGQRLAGLEAEYPELSLGYLPRFPENRLTLTVHASTVDVADAILEKASQSVVGKLGLHVYGVEDDTLETVVGALLQERGYTLALAESCTGGLIANLITNVSGSSAYFDRSMVTYSAAAKIHHLFVPTELVSRYGVVSAEVAEAMVRGLQRESEATIALAVTGLAGPSGGTPQTPIGTVFLALICDKGFRLERFQLSGDRQRIKLAAAYIALDWLRRAIIDDSFFNGGQHRNA